MYWIPIIIAIIITIVVEFKTTRTVFKGIVAPLAIIGMSFLVIYGDITSQTTAYETWSGKIVDVKHHEEYDEYIPPQTTCTTVNGSQSCTTTPGYWEHVDATNKIETSDDGTMSVSKSLDGKTRFDDSFPNTDAELEQFYPIGKPTASIHSYTNKVQASYSIFKHKDVDLKKFPDLPDYPKLDNYIEVNRIVGDVPNKKEALDTLAELNTILNKTITVGDKKRSWKQVNLLFVNVGVNKKEDYGFALQDKWKGGNKNDFVISFSTDEKGNFLWVYPFSWSDVESLKLDIRDYVMKQKNVSNIIPIIKDTGTMIANKFERKEFAKFNYLHIELSTDGLLCVWFVDILMVLANLLLSLKIVENK